ncbi:tumor necrosis factor receptor superfamily member 14-like [Xyrauchen texanus]|uniref:tumor necrosis factor receptor superfamily member 14-like n=1 Tax=Xyrauchen texanus TaxID=154827 RepID=UPI002242949C|nr:tumor necrosis factor receptor superfamily member 14-like [Xyrauchen texanus]
MFTFRLTVIITIIAPLNYKVCLCGCGHAEYEEDNQCCPMCAPGNRVYWHCTDDTSTTCVPCLEYTFIDKPSGFTKCLSCTVCDTGQGLRVNKACTQSSDTVCGPLEGFYCIAKSKGSCNFAVEHSKCSPGQYIKQAGTGSTDTVCANCTGEKYSNGSFSSCLPHTKCEDMGLTEIIPGTYSSDAECGKPSVAPAIITTCIIGAVIFALIVICIWKKKQSASSRKTGIQESNKESHEKGSLTDVGGTVNESSHLSSENQVRQEMRVSILLDNDSSHSQEIVQPEIQWLKQSDFERNQTNTKNYDTTAI